MALLLKNATYIDDKTFAFSTTHIVVDKGISFCKELNKSQITDNYEHIIDCKNNLVTKSYACGHHHVYSALSRGMPAPPKSPENFCEILKLIWWKLDKLLDKEITEASAYATAIACAKNGVTFVIDHHSSPLNIEKSLDIISEAFDKVGVSHLLCYEISDRDGKEICLKGLEESERYLKKNQALIGLHASFTVSDFTIKEAVSLAKKYNSGIHIHVAEDIYDQYHCVEKYNKRVVERLNDGGVLDFEKTILAHCIHIDDNERALIQKSNVYVVQNPDSNLKNKVGFFNSSGLNNNIMLGTDGMHSDMLRSSKIAYFSGLQYEKIDYLQAYQRLRNVNSYIKINNFKGDEDNNLVVLDYQPPTDIKQGNFLSHFIFGIESKHVNHVISSGKLIVKNKVLLTVNEEEVMSNIRQCSKKLWEKM